MLKNIPSILSPDLLKILMEMGHGDEIVIADSNFPAASIARHTVSRKLIRLDGHGIPAVLEAIHRSLETGETEKILPPPPEIGARYARG